MGGNSETTINGQLPRTLIRSPWPEGSRPTGGCGEQARSRFHYRGRAMSAGFSFYNGIKSNWTWTDRQANKQPYTVPCLCRISLLVFTTLCWRLALIWQQTIVNNQIYFLSKCLGCCLLYSLTGRARKSMVVHSSPW